MKSEVNFLIATFSLIVAAALIGFFVGADAREKQIYNDCIKQNDHLVVREAQVMCARLVGREAE